MTDSPDLSSLDTKMRQVVKAFGGLEDMLAKGPSKVSIEDDGTMTRDVSYLNGIVGAVGRWYTGMNRDRTLQHLKAKCDALSGIVVDLTTLRGDVPATQPELEKTTNHVATLTKRIPRWTEGISIMMVCYAGDPRTLEGLRKVIASLRRVEGMLRGDGS